MEVNDCACGSTSEIESTKKGNGFFVYCLSCGKESDVRLKKEDAIQDWNDIN